MNKDRRARIAALQAQLQDIMSALDEIRNEEQEAYDNLPESFQDGERGEAMQTAIEAMESAMESCEEAEGYLEEAQE